MREVLERPQLRLVPHVGYVSLFPFIGRLIPPVSYTDNLILKTMLDLLFGASVCSYSGARKYKVVALFLFIYFFFCVVVGLWFCPFGIIDLSSVLFNTGIMDSGKTA